MKLQAVRPVTPPMKLCHNCRHGDKSLSHPNCKGCGKPGNKYAKWEEK